MSRCSVAAALVAAAASSSFAQDGREPNPSLGRLAQDEAYERASAEALRTVGMTVPAAIRVDASGRVLVAGMGPAAGPLGADGAFVAPMVVRLAPDGAVDARFGRRGVVAFPFPRATGGLPILGLAVDPAGRVVVTGLALGASETGPPFPAAARLGVDGVPDRTFGDDGILAVDPSAMGVVALRRAETAGPDGATIVESEIITAGPGGTVGTVGFLRVTPEGALDADYGFVAIRRPAYLTSFAVDAAGRVVAASRDYGVAPSAADHGVIRLDAHGVRDPSFGTGGKLRDAAGAPLVAESVAFDGAGRLVGRGRTTLWRRLPDGTSDLSFSGDGFSPHVRGGYLRGAEGGDGFLAVASAADRYALVGQLRYSPRGRSLLYGLGVAAVVPTDRGIL